MSRNLLELKNVNKIFITKKSRNPKKQQSLKAVNNISFTLEAGQTLGIVGESGCGKSTLARIIMRLIDSTSGEILFDGNNIEKLGGENLRKTREGFQMVFQDPYASFNPRMTIKEILEEPLKHHGVPKAQWSDRISEMLQKVNMPKDALSRYPHEFSGGQRQRISIARALILKPKLVVADEPVAALDVSIQTQILNLFCDLKKEFNIGMIFISHNLATVEYVSDKIAVMYLGHMVELASAKELYENPRHPYTQLLISSIPAHSPEDRKIQKHEIGELPDQLNPPLGCPFSTRCTKVTEECKVKPQTLREVSEGHFVACQLI